MRHLWQQETPLAAGGGTMQNQAWSIQKAKHKKFPFPPKENNMATLTGLEPARDKPNRFLVCLLDHSDSNRTQTMNKNTEEQIEMNLKERDTVCSKKGHTAKDQACQIIQKNHPKSSIDFGRTRIYARKSHVISNHTP